MRQALARIPVAMTSRRPVLGIVQWFSFEDHACVEQAVGALTELRATELRVLFSWADWAREGGPEWFDWYVPRLASVPGMRLLPSLFYTPPQLARKDGEGGVKTSYPPEDLASYARFVEEMIRRYGAHFDWIQLWNEPNWKPYWDWDMDRSGEMFADMAVPAANAARQRGKKVVLGGTTPLDYAWFARMEELGVLEHMDAVSFHYSPSWDNQHRRWMPLATELYGLRALLKGFGRQCEIWIDETGFSTRTSRDKDEDRLEREQVAFFDEMRALPAERVYWFCLFDQPEHIQTDDAINTGADSDPTAYHFGIIARTGRRKPLYEHWKRREG